MLGQIDKMKVKNKEELIKIELEIDNLTTEREKLIDKDCYLSACVENLEFLLEDANE